jgi:hypothetical protein
MHGKTTIKIPYFCWKCCILAPQQDRITEWWNITREVQPLIYTVDYYMIIILKFFMGYKNQGQVEVHPRTGREGPELE